MTPPKTSLATASASSSGCPARSAGDSAAFAPCRLLLGGVRTPGPLVSRRAQNGSSSRSSLFSPRTFVPIWSAPCQARYRAGQVLQRARSSNSAGQRLRSATHRTAELVGASGLRRLFRFGGSIGGGAWDGRPSAAGASGVRARGRPHRDDERLPARNRPEQQGDRLGLEREPEQIDRRGELRLHLGDSRRRPISAEISAAAIPRKWRAIRYSLTTSATSVNATLIGTSAIDGCRPAPNTTPWPTTNPTATATIPTCQLVIATTPYHRAVARTAPMAPPITPPAMSPIVAGSAGFGAVTSATGIPLASVAVAKGAAGGPRHQRRVRARCRSLRRGRHCPRAHRRRWRGHSTARLQLDGAADPAAAVTRGRALSIDRLAAAADPVAHDPSPVPRGPDPAAAVCPTGQRRIDSPWVRSATGTRGTRLGPMSERIDEALPPPTRHVTTTRIVAVRGDGARGSRRSRRRRGAARDPGCRAEPGAGGRGRDDADARLRGRARGRLPAHRGPHRGPGGAPGRDRRSGDDEPAGRHGASFACRAPSMPRASPSAISSPRRRAGSAARPRSTRSPSVPSRSRPAHRSSPARRSWPCRTRCALPSARSTRPAACTRRGCSHRAASCSCCARTSGGTTRSTR